MDKTELFPLKNSIGLCRQSSRLVFNKTLIGESMSADLKAIYVYIVCECVVVDASRNFS